MKDYIEIAIWMIASMFLSVFIILLICSPFLIIIGGLLWIIKVLFC